MVRGTHHAQIRWISAMITIHWNLLLSPGWSEEEFDDWYLNQHTNYGKNSPGIVRYCVNRAIREQPLAARGRAFRVAEECWRDFEAAEQSWNLPLGHAVLGDAMANLGMLDGRSLPGIAITVDRLFEVSQPASFNPLRRGFMHRNDGTISKFLAFGTSKAGDGIGDWYASEFSNLGLCSAARGHVFGTTLGRRLQVGRLITIPGEAGQVLYDWALELWFDDNPTARQFLDGPEFVQMWSALERESTNVSAALYRGQEMLIVADPIPHVDD